MTDLKGVLLLALLASAARAEEPSCVTHCHGKEATAFAVSVHAEEISCIDCHGGDPSAHGDKEKSHDTGSGYRGVPPRAEIPELCGSCHSDPARMIFHGLPTDQLAHYRNSQHGRALFLEEDAAAAVCSDCHDAHEVLPARDPRSPTAPANQPATCGRCHADAESMEAQGLPSDTVERFLGSVHARALLEEGARGAPSCADCHGTHGAAPPGVKDMVQVCGHCHSSTSAQYRRGPHFRAEGMSCVVCHGSHLVTAPGEELYRGEDSGHCGDCHRDSGEADRVIEAILGGTGRLRSAMAATKEELRQAKSRGLFLENEKVYLRESQRALVLVRPLAHALDAEGIGKHLSDGLAHQSRTQEELARKRTVLRDRKLLLSGIALVLLLLLGLLLVKLDAVRRLS